VYWFLIRLYNYTGAGQNNGNSIQHRNETVCVGCTERTRVVCILRYSFVCLHCGVPVSMQYTWCLVTVHMEIQQNRRQVIFSKRTYCWCEFSWSICNQNGHLLDVSRAAVSKVMRAYTNHGKTSSVKRNSGRKKKWVQEMEGDCVYKSKNYCRKVTAEIIINLVDPVSTKTLDGCFTNPTSKAELQLLNIWLLKTVLKGEKDGVMITKTVGLTSGKT